MNMIGNEEKYELILNKIEMNEKMKIEIMGAKIYNLENKVKELIQEKNEMENKINDLSNEN